MAPRNTPKQIQQKKQKQQEQHRHRIVIIQATHANCVDLCALSLRSRFKLCVFGCLCLAVSCRVCSDYCLLSFTCSAVRWCWVPPAADRRTNTRAHSPNETHDSFGCLTCAVRACGVCLCVCANISKLACGCGVRSCANTLSERARNTKSVAKMYFVCE